MFSHIKELFTRPSGYNIARSVRTRASASGNFTRTLSTPTDSTKFTFSAWIKRGSLSSSQGIFQAGNTNYIQFGSGDTIQLVLSNTAQLTTTAVFRDPSAWGHLVFSYNNAASPKWNFYYNNANIGTSTASNTTLNTATAHGIANPPSGGGYFDGYLTEINFIDGQALTPSSFGETDSITGVWKAKKYSGTYGTNGFYLNFSDNSSNTATTIGKDYSGNGNNWTPNNISVTAGTTYDSMVDSPTVSATSSNYAVLNPLTLSGSGYTLSNGNLDISSTAVASVYSTVAVNTGKYYAEFTLTTAPSSAYAYVGVRSVTGGLYVYRSSDGQYYDNSTYSAYGASYTTNDVIGVAIDGVNGTITFYKNGTSQGQKTGLTIVNDTTYYLTPTTTAATGAFSANFGQRPFTYTPPTGFVALNTYNLPASTIKNGAAYMAATTYSANNGTQSINNSVNGISFQPDFIWTKSRSNAYGHLIYDSIRGVGNFLQPASTAAESNNATTLISINSNGYTVGANDNSNLNTGSSVGWQWKAGGTSSSNTNGSITSTVSAGATQGFSVVTYTGTGANATVGHGLGVAPSMAIIKRRSTSGSNWLVYHVSMTATSALYLNTTEAKQTFSDIWNNTAPTSTVMSLGTTDNCNLNGGTYVGYFFAAVAGYSAFGSYTGNGSTDGTFVYTGFRPRFVMIKRTDSANNWVIYDTARDTFNKTSKYLYAQSSQAEVDDTVDYIDILSNGFKPRATWSALNASGGTYIYMAFAENPTKYALAR